MVDWLKQMFVWLDLTWGDVALGVALFIITFAGSIAAVTFVLIKLPPTYFQISHTRDFWADRHAAVRWSGMFVKNLFGLVLVLLGIVMSVPGVPGQGVLTILLGLILLDFPGKRQLEYRLVSRPKVLRAINSLRARFDKPPMVLDEGKR